MLRLSSLFFFLTLFLLISFIIACSWGTIPISLTDWVAILLGKDEQKTNLLIVQYVRLPRVLLACFTGASLAVGGVVMQGLFRNPLVEPSLVGISSGSALFAVICIVFGQTLLGDWYAYLGNYILPLFAFAGGLSSTLIAQKLAMQDKQTAITRLLLVGMALNSLAGAAIGFILFFAEDNSLRNFTFWSLGSLGNITWEKSFILLPLILIAITWLYNFHKALDVLILGEAEAYYLGINVERTKKKLILINALLIGSVIAFVGMIGFIGLTVPHIIRLMGINKHRALLPLAAILGAILLLWADILARNLFSPAEIPVGIITALLGTPFFLFLLLKNT